MFWLVVNNFNLDDDSRILFIVKPAHVITSIKQSPVLKGYHFLDLTEIFIVIEPLLRGHLSYKVTILLSKR